METLEHGMFMVVLDYCTLDEDQPGLLAIMEVDNLDQNSALADHEVSQPGDIRKLCISLKATGGMTYWDVVLRQLRADSLGSWTDRDNYLSTTWL